MNEDDFSEGRMFFDAVREVAGEAGLAALLQHLQRHCGGAEFYVVGNRVSDRSPLTQVLGPDAASRIIGKIRVIGANDRACAGFRVYIPLGTWSSRCQARAAALDAMRSGMTMRQAARHARLSERTVGRAVRDYREATGRRDAFPRARRNKDAALLTAYTEGQTAAEMAARLCIGRQALRRRIRGARLRTGLAIELCRAARPIRPPRAAKPIPAVRYAALIAAHAEGPTVAEMTARLGISPAALYSFLYRARIGTGLSLELCGPMPPTYVRPPAQSRKRATEREVRPPAQSPKRERMTAMLLAAHAEGLTPDDIARRFGWKTGYVYCRFWRLRQETGLALRFDRAPVQHRKWGEHRRVRQAEVEAAYDEGLSTPQVAERLGLSISTVKNYRAKLRFSTGRPFLAVRSRPSATLPVPPSPSLAAHHIA